MKDGYVGDTLLKTHLLYIPMLSTQAAGVLVSANAPARRDLTSHCLSKNDH